LYLYREDKMAEANIFSIGVARASGGPAPSSRDIVLAILALAAKEGRNKVKVRDALRAFASLQRGFKELFNPPFLFQGILPYSKRLDSILTSFCGSLLHVTALNELEMKIDTAERQIAWLKNKYGPKFLDGLSSVVKRFVELTA